MCATLVRNMVSSKSGTKKALYTSKKRTLSEGIGDSEEGLLAYDVYFNCIMS